MSPLALKSTFFLVMLATLFWLVHWAMQVSEKPKELTSKVESAISPASEILLGEDQLMAMTLKSKTAKFQFALRPNTWWWMLEPERFLARQSHVQMWIGALSKPKLMRVLEPQEWSSQNPSQVIEVELQGQHSLTQMKYMVFPSQPQFYYLQLSNGVVLKAEKLVDLSWSDKVDDWRSRRLWPFELDAVQKMIYRQSGKERVWQKTDQGWSSTGSAIEVWKIFFKNWNDMGVQSFVEHLPPNTTKMAEWEFFFDSGDKSMLELFKSEFGEWMVAYRGRELAMVIAEDTLREAFPEGPWVK